MSAPCKLRIASIALVLGGLAACPMRPNVPVTPTGQQGAAPAAHETPGEHRHEGRPFEIVSSESLLRILVYRAGALAKAGHNHVIASHDLEGTVYVAHDLQKSSFEVRVPVADLTVDEPALRAQENAPDFPPDVPESAKEGTRRNMLSEALLDGAHHPDIVLRSERIEIPSGRPIGAALAEVEITVRDARRSVRVPVHYELGTDELVIAGGLPLLQTDLGLTPFSALLGALQVQNEMRVRFRIVARAAQTHAGEPHRADFREAAGAHPLFWSKSTFRSS